MEKIDFQEQYLLPWLLDDRLRECLQKIMEQRKMRKKQIAFNRKPVICQEVPEPKGSVTEDELTFPIDRKGKKRRMSQRERKLTGIL